MKIRDVMSKDVQVARPHDTLQEVAARMAAGDFGFIPVADGENLIGAITDRDIALRAIAQGKDGSTKVRDVMSEGIFWVFEDESVEAAAKTMSERQVRRLPVVDRNKRLVGIVALGDFAVESSEIKPAAEALSEISKP